MADEQRQPPRRANDVGNDAELAEQLAEARRLGRVADALRRIEANRGAAPDEVRWRLMEVDRQLGEHRAARHPQFERELIAANRRELMRRGLNRARAEVEGREEEDQIRHERAARRFRDEMRERREHELREFERLELEAAVAAAAAADAAEQQQGGEHPLRLLVQEMIAEVPEQAEADGGWGEGDAVADQEAPEAEEDPERRRRREAAWAERRADLLHHLGPEQLAAHEPQLRAHFERIVAAGRWPGLRRDQQQDRLQQLLQPQQQPAAAAAPAPAQQPEPPRRVVQQFFMEDELPPVWEPRQQGRPLRPVAVAARNRGRFVMERRRVEGWDERGINGRLRDVWELEWPRVVQQAPEARQAEAPPHQPPPDVQRQINDALHNLLHVLMDRQFVGGAEGGGQGDRAAAAARGGVMVINEEMAREAAELREADANDKSSARFSRACPVCVTENPRKRAVFTQCGHIVCYPCAVDNAKINPGAVKCVFCRATSGFVKLFEEEQGGEQAVDEGSRSMMSAVAEAGKAVGAGLRALLRHPAARHVTLLAFGAAMLAETPPASRGFVATQLLGMSYLYSVA